MLPHCIEWSDLAQNRTQPSFNACPGHKQFDDDSIKNKRASVETPISRYKSMGNFLAAQGQLTPKSVVRSGRNSNLSEILCMSSLPASIIRVVTGQSSSPESGFPNKTKMFFRAKIEEEKSLDREI